MGAIVVKIQILSIHCFCCSPLIKNIWTIETSLWPARIELITICFFLAVYSTTHPVWIVSRSVFSYCTPENLYPPPPSGVHSLATKLGSGYVFVYGKFFVLRSPVSCFCSCMGFIFFRHIFKRTARQSLKST